jgi:hypothetical protein
MKQYGNKPSFICQVKKDSLQNSISIGGFNETTHEGKGFAFSQSDRGRKI